MKTDFLAVLENVRLLGTKSGINFVISFFILGDTF